MKYRKLGTRGPEVPVLGFGCMRLPLLKGDGERIDEPAATRLLHAAIERGVTYVDTAYPYHQGESEPWLGRALQGGYREQVLLATKLPSWAIETRADCDKYLNEQLVRLKTQRIDCFLLHCLKRAWWEKLKSLGVLEFLDAAQQDGRIGYAGFSFHDDFAVFEEIVPAYDWAFCQVQYNYMDEDYQAGARGVRLAAQRGLGVVAMEPLRGGNLAKPLPQEIQDHWPASAQAQNPVERAFRWLWHQPEVSLVLTSMSLPAQLEENLRLAATAQACGLSADDLAAFNRVRTAIRSRAKAGCTACQYCMPCPQGVAIPKILSYYNDRFVFDDRKSASIGYQFLLAPEQQATACNECGQCEEVCPQHLPIRELLKAGHLELGGS